MGVGGERHAPAAFLPGRGCVCIRAGLDGFWLRENPLSRPWIEPRTVQAVAIRFTDYAIPAPYLQYIAENIEVLSLK